MDQTIQRSVELARQKFTELDADRSGFLETSEIAVLVSWVLEQSATPAADREDIRSHIMISIDANGYVINVL